jgi:hypothetical protein
MYVEQVEVRYCCHNAREWRRLQDTGRYIQLRCRVCDQFLREVFWNSHRLPKPEFRA